jgi:hypothetical protein
MELMLHQYWKLAPGAAAPFQQDFILADHPIFFARNVQHIFDFLAATAAGTPDSHSPPKPARL